MVTKYVKPSYHQGFANNAEDSARPQDWRGLVGLWLPQLGPSGITLRDWSGFANHGTLTNMDPATDWIIDGEYGYVLDLEKANDYIGGMGTLPQLDDVVPLTLIAWVNGRSFTETTVDINTIIGKESSGFSENVIIRVGDAGIAANRLQFVVRGDGESAAKLDGSLLNTGQWYCIAVTYEVSGRQAIYIDGLLDAEQTTANGTIMSGSNFEIGRSTDDVGRLWDGQIAQVRAYAGVALTAPHIQAIYEDPLGIVRLADDVIGKAPVVVGTTVPIFHHHYQLLRTA